MAAVHARDVAEATTPSKHGDRGCSFFFLWPVSVSVKNLSQAVLTSFLTSECADDAWVMCWSGWRPHPLMLARIASRVGASARHRAGALPRGRRTMCAGPVRTDGFNEALPRNDYVAPIFFAGIYAFSWFAADEGHVKALQSRWTSTRTRSERDAEPIFPPHMAVHRRLARDALRCRLQVQPLRT